MSKKYTDEAAPRGKIEKMLFQVKQTYEKQQKCQKTHEIGVPDGQVRENREAKFEEIEAENFSKLTDLRGLGCSALEDAYRARY